MTYNLLLVTECLNTARWQRQLFEDNGIKVLVLNHELAKHELKAQELEKYHLILLDVFDEESQTIEFCRVLRADYHSPVLALIYTADERLQLRLYTAGADDCVAHPFGAELLLAKVLAWLRRVGDEDEPVDLLKAYKFRFNLLTSEVMTPRDNLVRLSQLEARLLHLLMVNCGSVVATGHIIQRVWRDHGTHDGNRHTLKALVRRLRRKIEVDPSRPQYVHAFVHEGYSFHLN